MFASGAVAGRRVLCFGTFDGKVIALDLESQEPLWMFQTDASGQNFPAISDADETLNFALIVSRRYGDWCSQAFSVRGPFSPRRWSKGMWFMLAAEMFPVRAGVGTRADPPTGTGGLGPLRAAKRLFSQ
jgi:hypothetical protein